MTEALLKLTGPIQEGRWPVLPCPGCSGDVVVGEVTELESRLSRLERDHPAFEPEWVHGVFAAFAECIGCSEQVAIAGSFEVEMDQNATFDGYDELYSKYYTVKTAVPGFRIMRIPEKTPPEVADQIQEAASIIWRSPYAAANALRRAVEFMLTDLGVPRYRASKPGKQRSRYTTHQRIELRRLRDSEITETLMAVKWVGNSGSHENTLTMEQVLETAGLLEYALRLAYDKSDSALRKRVARINQKRRAV